MILMHGYAMPISQVPRSQKGVRHVECGQHAGPGLAEEDEAPEFLDHPPLHPVDRQDEERNGGGLRARVPRVPKGELSVYGVSAARGTRNEEGPAVVSDYWAFSYISEGDGNRTRNHRIDSLNYTRLQYALD